MGTQRGKTRTLTLAVVLAALLGACDYGALDAPAGVSVLLTDAPGDVDEAWVKVDGIYLQGEGGREWLLDEQTDWIELTRLAGETTEELISDVVVSSGRYNQMRFIITEAYLVGGEMTYATAAAQLPDGVEATGTLQCPSCETPSGLKVNLPGGTVEVAEEAQILVVDFDVSESFGRQAGQSGMWVMRPLLRATDFRASGNIRGEVEVGEDVELPESCDGRPVDVSRFIPNATLDDITASGVTDEDGAFVIAFVTPGTHTLGFTAEMEVGDAGTLGFQAEVDPAVVTVSSGDGFDGVRYTITGATCEVEEGDGD